MKIYDHYKTNTRIALSTGSEFANVMTITPMGVTNSRMQRIKMDGQGNEYVTRFGKKIKLSDCVENFLISFQWSDQICSFDDMHKPIGYYYNLFENGNFDDDFSEVDARPDGTGHITLDYDYDGYAVFTVDNIGDYGVDAIINYLNSDCIGYYSALKSIIEKFYPESLDRLTECEKA